MTLSDDILMAYADGELDPKTRAEVEDAMAADPRIAGRVAAHRALRNTVRAGFDRVLEETVPERLVAAARATSRGPLGDGITRAPTRDGVVVPLRARRARTVAPARWGLPQWGAVAASFVLGALVLHFGSEWYSPGKAIAERSGQLLAAGVLDKALSTQLVSEQAAGSAVRIGVSFRSKDGSYCRTFQMREQTSLAGLACRAGDQWRLDVLARGEPSQDGGTGNNTQSGFRPAGSALPSSIVQAVDQAIDGEPLDAAAEAHARTNQWHGPQ